MLNHLNNTFIITEKFLSKDKCDEFIKEYDKRNPNPTHNPQYDNKSNWQYINENLIVNELKNFLENTLLITTDIHSAAIAMWIDGIEPPTWHKHSIDLRPENQFTSLIYLNENHMFF